MNGTSSASKSASSSLPRNADGRVGRRAMVHGMAGDVRSRRHDPCRSSLRAGIRALAHGLDLVRKSIARSLTNTFSGSTGRQDHEFCTDANIGTRSIPIESGPGSDEAMEEGREQEADLA